MLTTKCQRQSFRFSSELVENLISFSHKEQIEIQVPLLTTWASLFYRYTGLEQIVVGIGMEGKHDKAVPLSIDFSEMNSFRGQVKAIHKLLPNALHIVRDETTSAFTCSTLTSLSGLREEKKVTLEIVRTGTEWTGSLLYHKDHFEETAITRMLGHLQQLFVGYMNQPQIQIDQIPLLTGQESAQMLLEWNSASIQMVTEMEKQQILFDLNKTEAVTPDRTMHQLFEEQVRKTPNQIAVVHREVSLTYLQVNERANQLAWQLRHEGVTANTIVGLMVERSVEVVVGILGILKAGGAYVPVDPELPSERVCYLLDNSSAQVLITQSSLLDKVDYKGEIVDIHDPSLTKQTKTNPESGSQPDDLMYVIYTSGSTGNPKGVMIEHRSMVNYVTWFSEMAKLTADDHTILLSSYAFDLGYTSLYSSLLNGCVIHIADKDLVRIPEALLAYLGDHQISFIKGTPSLFRMMLHASSDHWRKTCETLRLVVLGGESMNAEEMRSFLQTYPHVQVINHYGPTETCVGAIAGFVDPEQLEDRISVPIGKPINNTKVYVLDSELQVVPAGVPGELFISGAGLARGYLHRPELTEERFLTNPFVDGERIYRTGDIVRLLPDRRVEFFGRADHQVKIRGFRIELGDIESTFMKHPDVHEAVVVAREFNSADDLRLVAYFTTKIDIKQSKVEQKKSEYSQLIRDLRIYLQQKLPEYMIPSYFIPLEQIPLTANGKMDRHALPQPQIIQGAHVAPRNEMEEKLAAIWRDVLQLESVGVEDHFLDVGGQSILATQILVRMRSEFQIDLTQRKVFEAKTIAEQAQVIAEAQKQGMIKTTSNVIVSRKRVVRKLQG